MNYRIVSLEDMKTAIKNSRKPRQRSEANKEDVLFREITTGKGFSMKVPYFKNFTSSTDLKEGDLVKIAGKYRYGKVKAVHTDCVVVKLGGTIFHFYNDQVKKVR